MMVILPLIGFLCGAAACVLYYFQSNALISVIMFLCAAANMYFLLDALNGGRLL